MGLQKHFYYVSNLCDTEILRKKRHSLEIKVKTLSCLLRYRNTQIGAGRMVQQVEVLAAKPGNLNSVSRTCMTEGENKLQQVVL